MILTFPNPDSLILGSQDSDYTEGDKMTDIKPIPMEDYIDGKYMLNKFYKLAFGKANSLYEISFLNKSRICYILHKRFLVKLYLTQNNVIDDISQNIQRFIC
jgi:hypothetical protein